jgi:acetyltransferase-like isoleucine patch superfamily enzyme
MLNIRKIVKAIYPKSKQNYSSDYVDHKTLFAAKIEHYRALGAQIGQKVRLMGSIDDINPHLVTIGDYSVIGTNSALLAHCPVKGAQPVSIGNFVYIGWGALILPGVTIGDCCIIGAGSVVTRDVPENSIVAGNPAKVLRQISEKEQQCLLTTLQENRKVGFDGTIL